MLCLVWLSALQAQTCNLRLQGLVTDSDDGSKLEFATISIMQNQKQVFTKSDGTFEFNNLCPGTYTIVCSHIGCKDTIISLNLTGNAMLNVVMPHKLNQLRELNVEGDKINHSDAAGLSVVSVTSQQLQPFFRRLFRRYFKSCPRGNNPANRGYHYQTHD